MRMPIMIGAVMMFIPNLVFGADQTIKRVSQQPSADHCMDPDRPAPDYYVHPSEVDLVHILAPPPAIASPQGKADLQAVLDAQRARTPAKVKNAQADACFSIIRFADVVHEGQAAPDLEGIPRSGEWDPSHLVTYQSGNPTILNFALRSYILFKIDSSLGGGG